jgi:hypothetical protein
MVPGVLRADLVLADSVAAAEGKLYIQGGGWNFLAAPSFPFRQSRLGIGLIMHVPYTATSEQHDWRLRIQDGDGTPIPLADAPPGVQPDTPEGKITQVAGRFALGRPPLLPQGAEQIVCFAMNIDGISIPQPGEYSAIVTVDGSDQEDRLTFWAVTLQQPGLLGGPPSTNPT